MGNLFAATLYYCKQKNEKANEINEKTRNRLENMDNYFGTVSRGKKTGTSSGKEIVKEEEEEEVMCDEVIDGSEGR